MPRRAAPQTTKMGQAAGRCKMSWPAAVLCRPLTARPKSARGLAHSKSFALSEVAGIFGSGNYPFTSLLAAAAILPASTRI
jgi:hypothetical protein